MPLWAAHSFGQLYSRSISLRSLPFANSKAEAEAEAATTTSELGAQLFASLFHLIKKPTTLGQATIRVCEGAVYCGRKCRQLATQTSHSIIAIGNNNKLHNHRGERQHEIVASIQRPIGRTHSRRLGNKLNDPFDFFFFFF